VTRKNDVGMGEQTERRTFPIQTRGKIVGGWGGVFWGLEGGGGGDRDPGCEEGGGREERQPNTSKETWRCHAGQRIKDGGPVFSKGREKVHSRDHARPRGETQIAKRLPKRWEKKNLQGKGGLTEQQGVQPKMVKGWGKMGKLSSGKKAKRYKKKKKKEDIKAPHGKNKGKKKVFPFSKTKRRKKGEGKKNRGVEPGRGLLKGPFTKGMLGRKVTGERIREKNIYAKKNPGKKKKKYGWGEKRGASQPRGFWEDAQSPLYPASRMRREKRRRQNRKNNIGVKKETPAWKKRGNRKT